VREVDPLLTPRELSARWNNKIAPKTLANWRSDPARKGPTFRRYGNKILYPLSAVIAFEKAREFGTTRDYDDDA
jgi:hypothetical protein